MNHKLLVLYDADCGFCSWTAGLLDRLDAGRRLRVVPLTEVERWALDPPPLHELYASIHVGRRDGSWALGGAAWLAIADAVPVLRPIGMVARLPLIRRLVEPVYSVIARTRHRLSRFVGEPACQIPRR